MQIKINSQLELRTKHIKGDTLFKYLKYKTKTNSKWLSKHIKSTKLYGSLDALLLGKLGAQTSWNNTMTGSTLMVMKNICYGTGASPANYKRTGILNGMK